MLQPSKIAPGFEKHEELFLERYRRLRAWALQLTENDRDQAEDLVHDTYIQFTLARPDLNTIGNLNGYLYTMMRNLRVSQLRRSLRRQHRTLSIIDYDSAEICLRAADPQEQIKLQDSLRQVCQYACMRKQSSKAGSVLILRFLHGYYPREIAQVMRSTRQAVEERLRIARNEARQYLQDPQSLRFMYKELHETIQASRMGFVQTTDNLINELRQTIFGSRQGDCFTRQQLENLYRENHDSIIGTALLAHLVSCPECLDEVNDRLNLPLLSDRFTTDTLGTDRGSKGGGGGDGHGGGDTGGPTGGASEDERRECRRQASAVSEHRPAELCISVNGYPMAAQKVRSELSEQTLSINVAERINFVEILSEQDIRLLFMPVEDTANVVFQGTTTRVQLSDNRSLEAKLTFDNPWPILHVVYSDPVLRNESAHEDTAAESNVLRTPTLVADSEDKDQISRKTSGPTVTLDALMRLLRRFGTTGFWLRPGMVTAVVALILITALVLTRLHVSTVSAAELLQRSTAADEAAAASPEVLVHRTINFEERKVNGDELIAHHRIEVWQSSLQGIRLRRVYDDQNKVIAGEWTKADGTSTVYNRGAKPQERTSPEVAGKAILETKELWRLDPSARDFNLLLGGPEAITVEETSDRFVLNYQGHQAGANSLLHATLTLNRADLHAIEQTLTVMRDGEAHAFRFIEAAFERKPKDSVNPSFLLPEPELLGTSEAAKDSGVRIGVISADSTQATASITHPSQAIASAELEIEVTYLLNRIKANLGEQVSLTRTSGGMLRVEALVETQGRKDEILRALGPVINNPSVKVEVSTVDEAIKRQPERSRSSEATVREVEVRNNQIPADSQLRSYFSTRLVGREAIDEEIKRYANRAMNHSRQALLQASALKRLVRRFSPEEIDALEPEARTKWLAMIREHAQAYQREIAALRQELSSVFGQSGTAGQEAIGETNLAQLADRLVQLSYANDEAVRSTFTVSVEGTTTTAIKSPHFWRSLTSAERLAVAIQSGYPKN
ncbi:MAG TPA: sigma-70 family RNA polymerase sigma factor [Pyrinomonadaceae bacterium]